MKHLLLVLFFCTTGLNAQTDDPYAPYRPGTYYRYENTMPVPDWGEVVPLTSPVVEMIWPRDPSLFIDGFYGYDAMVPLAEPGTYNIAPHFTGRLIEEPEVGMLYVTGINGFFDLNYTAPLGATYMASNNLRATVDSIVEETFLGITDSVKYISLTDTSSATIINSLKLSKGYGLIEGIYFDDPIRFTNTYPLIGISNWNITAGEIVTPQMIGSAHERDEYFVKREQTVTRNGQAGKQVSLLRHRAGPPNCDPVLDASFAPFTIKELSFFLPDDGSTPSDTVASPTRSESININFNPSEANWIAQPIGQAINLDRGNYVMILPATDDCLGTGKRLSRRFNRTEAGHYIISEDENPGPAQFSKVFLQSGEDLGTEGVTSRIIGLQTNHITCGEIIDFNPFYSSLHDFPNDPRIVVFPNPAETMVSIEIPMDLGPTSLKIYDATGKKTWQIAARNGSHTLSVDEWAGGIYTVIIQGEYGPVGQRRLVVE